MDHLCGFHDPSGIAQFPVSVFQRFVLARNKSCFFNLIDLKFQKGLFPVTLFLIHIQRFQLIHAGPILPVSFPDFLPGWKDPFFSVYVQNRQLAIPVKKGLMFMLPVNVQKAGCCCFHLADCACLSVDLVDTSAVHDLTGHQHLSVLRIDVKRRKGLSGFRIFNLK